MIIFYMITEGEQSFGCEHVCMSVFGVFANNRENKDLKSVKGEGMYCAS